MNAMIDTLKVSRSLEGAGFAQAQAEALAETFADAIRESSEEIATKDFVRAELAALKNDLIRWVLGSQVAVILVLVALSNFSRTFS